MPGLISSVDMKLGFDLGSEASVTVVRMAIRQSALIICFIGFSTSRGLPKRFTSILRPLSFLQSAFESHGFRVLGSSVLMITAPISRRQEFAPVAS